MQFKQNDASSLQSERNRIFHDIKVKFGKSADWYMHLTENSIVSSSGPI